MDTPPLYRVSNASDGVPGALVVALLVQAGANVNAQDQVKHCTPLHMAAHRGNVVVARALIGYGAAVEARDTNGDTPLHRAVKCGQAEMVAFLLSQGADVQAQARSGKTPWHMARGARIQAVLHTCTSQDSDR